MNKEEKTGKVLNITHKGELLFWLVIIMLLIGLNSLGIIFKEKKLDRDYKIFLQDVDGLIVGSPVRMMGIEVGHVTKIKPIKDEVYIKFILTNPDVYIPQGTQVTVEFSGMAGSKSLELYTPNKSTFVDKNSPVISVNPPKRLHDALGLLNDMFKKLASISYTASSFGAKLDETGIKTHKVNVINSTENFKDFLQYTNKFLDDSNEKATDLRNSLKRLQKNGE